MVAAKFSTPMEPALIRKPIHTSSKRRPTLLRSPEYGWKFYPIRAFLTAALTYLAQIVPLGNKQDVAYDKKTDHGETQGAVLH